MKQHITVYQLLELDDFVKIAELSGINIMKFLGVGTKPPHEDINIGKMIEILDQNSATVKIYLESYPYIVLDGHEQNGFEHESGELCDALWEAVKDCLK